MVRVQIFSISNVEFTELIAVYFSAVSRTDAKSRLSDMGPHIPGFTCPRGARAREKSQPQTAALAEVHLRRRRRRRRCIASTRCTAFSWSTGSPLLFFFFLSDADGDTIDWPGLGSLRECDRAINPPCGLVQGWGGCNRPQRARSPGAGDCVTLIASVWCRRTFLFGSSKEPTRLRLCNLLPRWQSLCSCRSKKGKETGQARLK